MDHSGNLPAIYAKGFLGPIYATQATCHLCDIMLRDSAHIQMFEAEWRNRKGRRQGKPEFVPAYTMEDAMGVIQNFVPCPYEKTITPAPGIFVRFVDAGHLLGSASIELTIQEDGEEEKIVFSGDIGNLHQPLIKDPTYLHDADYVVMESTYGDRSHGERPDYVAILSEVIQHTFDRGGSVIIPSFAVGRTQEMLYFIRQIKEENRVTGHGNFKVYVDSPLANEATTIFNEHQYDCFDEEAIALVQKGINPLMFPGLRTSITSDDSRAINYDEDCKVIISASGMCDAGRIKHHLKHNLWDPRNTILFVGYQAIGTLGRALIEGAEDVKLFGETVHVGAEIRQMPGISGHADVNGLIDWIKAFGDKPKKVFVTHGDDEVTEIFAAVCMMRWDWTPWLRSAVRSTTSRQTTASMRHRVSASPRLPIPRRQAKPQEHSRNWLPWDSALCPLSARARAFRTKTSTALRETSSRCVINGTEMISDTQNNFINIIISGGVTGTSSICNAKGRGFYASPNACFNALES